MYRQIQNAIGAILLFTLACVPMVISAATLESGERANVSEAETVNDDLYIGGGMVSASGSILGDLFAGGGTVTVDGDVSQDLHAAGGTVTVLGGVSGDARVAGGNIMIAGSVSEDLVVVGGQTQVTAEDIAGDFLWAGGTLDMDAPVAGDVQLYGKEVYISTSIEGDVRFHGQQLVLEDGADIQGDLSYSAPQEVKINEGATVAGEVNYEQTEPSEKEKRKGLLAAIGSGIALIWLLTRLVGAFVVGLGLPHYTNDIVTAAFDRPWAQLGRGIATLVLMPIVGVLLMITIVGIPLGGVILLGYAATLILTMLFAPILLGSLAYRWVKKQSSYTTSWLTILLGVLLYALLGLIPILGWLVQFGFVLLVLGAMIDVKWRAFQEYRS